MTDSPAAIRACVSRFSLPIPLPEPGTTNPTHQPTNPALDISGVDARAANRRVWPLSAPRPYATATQNRSAVEKAEAA
jgi:hypothetical protein